ncbi:TPA: M1 family metallopeptidase [Streptococcus agalactiae]|nr:M1 family metallopeptidase [Streptococcus agalactiae]
MKTVEHFVTKFVPENYNLFLDINRQTKTFSGNVAVSGEALDNNISFHQKGLTIKSVLLDNQPLDFQLDEDNEAMHIQLHETGSMVLVFEFSGHITDNMTGMYPSYYTVNGIKKEVISTQFESHFAREVFPSIDEPEAKATFDLSLKFDQKEGEIALSNMPEINAEQRQETGLWTFDTTPKMSSYLLAFALGELHGKTTHTKNGTLVGSYATKAHQLNELDFSLDIVVRVIEFYEDYFGVRYPIPQSLHVALPDFSAGAMENWGLVTYREVYLLVDENSSVSSRQQVALVVAHEIAHQWFGNLVTMKWWDDLWLNESFANMMEYVSIDYIEPKLNIFEDFQTGGLPLALKRDATDGVQSVHVEVNHPDEINTLFDPAIVYAKGSRLMHMLRRWLGDTDFAAGLKIYFEKHQYQNTIGRDLWNALSQTSGKDVAAFMDSWLEQPGYPVMAAKIEEDELILTQKQFFIGEHEDKSHLWQIPLNSNWEGIPEILTEETVVIPNFSQLAEKNKENGALRFNTENTAHYITNYQGQLLEHIISDLPLMDNISKLQIVQERHLLAESGMISYSSLIPLVSLLSQETSYLVNSAIKSVIDGLSLFVQEDSQDEFDFKEFVNKLSAFNFNRLGFEKREGEGDDSEMVRHLSLSLALYSDNEHAIEEAHHIFKAHENNIAAIPAAIRLLVLTNEMKHFESKELSHLLLETYSTTTDGNFKRQLASALSHTTDSKTLKKLLSDWKNKDIVKPQDLAMSWYATFLKNSFTQESVWEWAQENWEWIKATLGGDMSFDKFVIYPSSSFKTEERLEQYKNFFEPQLSDMAISRNISMGIKEISARVLLITKQKEEVINTIKKYI